MNTLTKKEQDALDSFPKNSVNHWIQGEWWDGEYWYIPLIKPKSAGISDNDIGLTEMPMCCQRFECQIWKSSKLFSPKLQRNDRGFMECPKCLGSYGK